MTKDRARATDTDVPSLPELCDQINEAMEDIAMYVQMTNSDPSLAHHGKNLWTGERMAKLRELQVRSQDLHRHLVENYGENSFTVTDGPVVGAREIEGATESYSAEPFGKIFTISRQTMSNDDLGAFSRIPRMMSKAKIETPVMRLFRQWEQVRSDAHGVSDAECDLAIEQIEGLENQMVCTPSETMADLAAKVAAFSVWGQSSLPEPECEFWHEIKALIGVDQDLA